MVEPVQRALDLVERRILSGERHELRQVVACREQVGDVLGVCVDCLAGERLLAAHRAAQPLGDLLDRDRGAHAVARARARQRRLRDDLIATRRREPVEEAQRVSEVERLDDREQAGVVELHAYGPGRPPPGITAPSASVASSAEGVIASTGARRRLT